MDHSGNHLYEDHLCPRPNAEAVMGVQPDDGQAGLAVAPRRRHPL